MTLTNTYGYSPYTGSAGPSDELIRSNNIALIQLCQEVLGLEGKIIPNPLNSYHEIIAFESVGVAVGYDRWGYTGHINRKWLLDQADLEETLEFLKSLLQPSGE